MPTDRSAAELRELRARVETLEQLLDVYERSVLDQSDKLYAEQERLLLQTTLLESQGEAAPDGILSTAVDGRILFANRRLSEMWGIEPPVVGTKTFGSAMRAMAERSTEPARFLRGSASLETAEESRDEITVDDGRTFERYTAPIRGHDGALLGRVWRFRDVSEAKEIDRMKNEFISAVSHELRTPLTSIRGSLDLITSGVTGDLSAEAMSLAKIAQGNCRRLVRLINDILDIEKVEAGRMEFRLEPVGLEALLEESIESMRPYAQELDVELRLSCDAPGAQVRGDADRLLQVMENLLSNAAKYSPAGEAVLVTLERRNSGLRVAVSDRGPGIPEKFRGRLFEKFAQIDSPGARRKEGTGLGLNIAQAIVEHHGGTMGFEPSPGAGSRFFFELPEVRV